MFSSFEQISHLVLSVAHVILLALFVTQLILKEVRRLLK
jgi:hypothetical protein